MHSAIKDKTFLVIIHLCLGHRDVSTEEWFVLKVFPVYLSLKLVDLKILFSKT